MRLSVLGTSFELTIPATFPTAYRDCIGHAWARCVADSDVAGDLPAIADLAAPSPADDSDESVRAAMQRLSQSVTRHVIGAQTGNLLMFHAGAVSHPVTGRSLVYVAPSGTGKTTLSQLLGTSNGYITDETAAIDPATARILPYPKPLSVSPDGTRRKRETPPDDLGLLPAHATPRLARIILLRRDPELTGGPLVEELGTLDAILALLPESSGTVRLRRPLHLLSDLLDATGPVLRFTYREAADIVVQASALIGGVE